MKVHAYATMRHYAAHLEPIWASCGPRRRGVRTSHVTELPRDGLVMVASYADLRLVGERPVVYVEHGAGQAYVPFAHPSYSGSSNPTFGKVRLFVCPNEQVAARWREAWPDIPAVAVGCPRMDVWHRDPGEPDRALIGWTWHWDCKVVPESRSALGHYLRHLGPVVGELRRAGYDVLGHGHPKWGGQLEPMWDKVGVRYTPDPDVLLRDCGSLIVDNSSMAYEFASLDRPVLSLNAPWYRREVEHGLRFWSLIPGMQCNEPGELASAAIRSADDHELARFQRRRVVGAVYGPADGDAGKRAAHAVAMVL